MAAKTKPAKQEEDQEKKGPMTEVDFAKKFMATHKEYHYNLTEEVQDYNVSSGSIILDSVLSGGFHKGLLRFTGASEGGKTSEALTVMHNMLVNVPNTKGLYIKAEGRLSPQVQERSGIRFTTDVDDWEVGSCLIFESNVFDVVFDFMRGLLKNNPNKVKFCIVVDSADGLIPMGDLEKTSGEAGKVAGGALLTSDFLKRVSLGMTKMGHLAIFLSQVRAKVDTSMYAKADPNNRTNASGGNAQIHYPDWILEFQKQYRSDYIAKNEDAPLSLENPPIGHYAKVLVCKSTNETTGMIIKYPIKHGRTGGSSVWVEREIIEMLLMWEFIEKKGSWFHFDEEIKAHCLENEFEIKSPIQGMDKLYLYLEENKELTEILKKFVVENCIKQ